MEILTFAIGEIASAALKASITTIGGAWKNLKIMRAESVLMQLNTCYETMSEFDKKEFDNFVNSQRGNELLAEFLESASDSKSKIAIKIIALAFIYSKNKQLSEDEARIVSSAMPGITDEQIDFFVFATNHIKPIEIDTIYPRHIISHKNNSSWDAETVYIYVDDLIRRRLLAPNPSSGRSGSGFSSSKQNEISNWYVPYGVTSKSIKFAKLFDEARNL